MTKRAVGRRTTLSDPSVPDNVRATFDKIRQHTKWDLEAIFQHDHGGNFSAALIIAVCCEAISRLLEKPTDYYLAALFTKHGVPAPIADGLAGALRHGVAHVYETLYLDAGAMQLELVISWGARRHLAVRRDPPGVYINVRTMWEDLRSVLDHLHATLPPGGFLPERWLQKDTVHRVDHRHAAAWRAWFAAASDG